MSKVYKLYDEDIVKEIMLETAMVVFESAKNGKLVNINEVCDYVDFCSEDIITEALEDSDTE